MNGDGDVQSSLLPISSSGPAAIGSSPAWNMQRGFPTALSVILVGLIAAFAVFTKYSDDIDTDEFYMYYIHVAVMVFVGFGFLMTFLKRYNLSAVSLNFVTSCMMMLAAILLVRAFSTSKLDGRLAAHCSGFMGALMRIVIAKGCMPPRPVHTKARIGAHGMRLDLVLRAAKLQSR